MPSVRSLLVVLSLIVTVSVPGASVMAQPPQHGSTEFAILPSVNLLSWDGGDESATALTFPTVSPGIRMTFWTRTSLTVDFGLSFGHIAMDNDDDATLLTLEGGLGADLAPSAGKWHPFVGALVGYLSIAGSSGFGQDGLNDQKVVVCQVYCHVVLYDLQVASERG